jgi:undecaprenyl-diphosphatase
VAVLVILAAGGWHVTQRHEKDLTFYALRHDVQSMSQVKWLTDGWRELPAWRIDMAGEREQPLTIQWAGSPEDLSEYLLTNGWHRPPSLNLKNFLSMFSPDIPIEELPVLPRLHDGRIDSLRLFHQTKGQQWVLRLWPSGVKIAGNSTPIFVGTIEGQQRRHLTGLITLARNMGDYDRSLDKLKDVLHDRFAMKLLSRTSNEVQVSSEDRRLQWSGSILLVWKKTEL